MDLSGNAGNKKSKEILRQNSPLSGEGRESVCPLIIRLCRQYVLAISTAIVLLFYVALSRIWLIDHPEAAGKGILGFSSLVHFSAMLCLLALVGAVYYGLRIARQARDDARRNEKALEDARQLTEDLHHSEERFRIASECASDLVYERDLVANTARFFGLKASSPQVSYTMEGFRDSIHPDDREYVWAALENHLKTGAPFSEEYRISDNRGGYISVSDKAVAILNKDCKPIRLVGSTNDITERKRAEQLKSDFISFVTHQLRTPLSGIKWMMELAIDAKDNQEEMQSFIADARLSAERLIRLVNDLLDVSRLERGKLKVAPQPVDLEKLTRDAAAEINQSLLEMKQTLSIETADNLPSPVADRQLMRQAIVNLLSNSVKYTPPEGKIDIRIMAEQDSVRWEISDTGIGIPKEDQDKLFEKFFRAGNVLAVETEGMGLGLYLVRLTVELFGGRIWCESEEGVGSKFIFKLPVAPEV